MPAILWVTIATYFESCDLSEDELSRGEVVARHADKSVHAFLLEAVLAAQGTSSEEEALWRDFESLSEIERPGVNHFNMLQTIYSSIVD